MEDIVFPKGNEKEFISMALKLGYSSLIFVYDKSKEFKHDKVKIGVGKASGKGFRAVKSSEKDRQVMERGLADVMYDFELSSREDFIHHRNSGLNQVLCKLMSSKKIEYGISFSSILSNEGRERSRILGRVMQNIRLCKKYKVKIGIYSFARNPYEMRSPKDLQVFGKLLGL